MNRLARGTLFFLCAVVAVALPAYATDKTPDEWITEANQTLKADPQDAKAYYNRGTGYYGKGDYETAIKDLSMAIRLEPKAPDAYYNRGLSFRRQHKIDEAVSDFSKAIELNKTQFGYYFERCNALIVQNNYDGAIADCSDGIKLAPGVPELYFMRGLAFMLRGDLDQALTNSLEAIQIDPDYADAKRLMFEILLKQETVNQITQSTVSKKSVLVNKNVKIAGEGLGGGIRNISDQHDYSRS